MAKKWKSQTSPGSSEDPQEPSGSPSSSGNEGDPTNGQDPQGTPPASDPVPSGTDGIETEFKHPLTAGKTVEEIEALVAAQHAAIVDQTNQLEDLRTQPPPAPAAPAAPTPPGPVQTEITDDQFWQNPATATRETVRQVIRTELQEIIEPFKRNLATNENDVVWSKARELFPDIDSYKPLIDNWIQAAGNPVPTIEQLTQAYYTAVGVVAKGQATMPNAPATPPGTSPAPAHRPAPPQLPASNQPPPAPRGQPQERPLTEVERRLAREYFPGDPPAVAEAKYRAFQDAEPDEVLTLKVPGSE